MSKDSCFMKARPLLRALIFLHQVSHGYWLYTLLIPYFYQEGSFEYWLFRLLVLVITPFMAWVHCITSGTSAVLPKRRRDKNFMNPKEAALYQTCEKCEGEPAWKPMRAKHCKTQGSDVARFDHFCPVTLNTIGLQNHGIFIKTAYLHFLLSLIWMWMFPWYFWSEVTLLKNHSGPVSLFLMESISVLDMLFVGMILLMGFCIAIGHTFYALVNMTTLEQLSGVGSAPCKRRFGFYNFGLISNLRQVFPDPLWAWFLPLRQDNKYEGYYLPRVGIPREFFAVTPQLTEGHWMPNLNRHMFINDEEFDEKAREMLRLFRITSGEQKFEI